MFSRPPRSTATYILFPYTTLCLSMDIGFLQMVRKRGGWLSALFMGYMLTASAMQHFEADIAKAGVLALFIPLIMSSGGNSGSQATSLIIRALALQELRLTQDRKSVG